VLPIAGHLNRAMRDFVRAAGRCRALPTLLHLGHPGGEELVVPERPWYDHAARTDLVTRALDGLADPAPLVWLTRPGALDCTDADLRWHAAVRTAFGRHGLPLPGFHVVTRCGWAEVASGERHEWHRVRPTRQVG
jgi:hypothetical protein